MMIVSEVLDIYKAESKYVTNSMINTSFDDYGCVYKFLNKRADGLVAYRREIFIATSGTGALEGRTATTYIEIDKATQ